MTTLVATKNRFSIEDLTSFTLEELKKFHNSNEVHHSTLPKAIRKFREQRGIDKEMLSTENWTIYREIGKREGKNHPEQRPQIDHKVMRFDFFSEQWVPKKRYYACEDGTLTFEMVQGDIVVGCDHLSYHEKCKRMFKEMPVLEASGRDNVLCHVQEVTNFGEVKRWDEGEVVITSEESEMVRVLDINSSYIHEDIVINVSKTGVWGKGTVASVFKSGQNGFERRRFSRLRQMGAYFYIEHFCELFEKEVVMFQEQANSRASNFTKPGRKQFLCFARTYIDCTLVSADVRSILHGKICSRSFPDMLVINPNLILRMVGARILDDITIIVMSKMETDEVTEALTKYAQTMPYQSYVRCMKDDALQIPLSNRFVVCDIEHSTQQYGGQFRMFSPISAYVKVDKDVVTYKCFTTYDSENNSGGEKTVASQSHVLRTDNGPHHLSYNGGLHQWRRDLELLAEQGYLIFAKGAYAEAAAIADYGFTVRTPRVSLPMINGSPLMNASAPSSFSPKPVTLGPNGIDLTVYEIYGKTYDEIKKHYCPLITDDIYQEIRNSNYRSLHHHPLAECFTFAKHILLNRDRPMSKSLNSVRTLQLQNDHFLMHKTSAVCSIRHYLESIFPYPNEISIPGASRVLVSLVRQQDQGALNIVSAQCCLQNTFPQIRVGDILAANGHVFTCFNGMISFTDYYRYAFDMWEKQFTKKRIISALDISEIEVANTLSEMVTDMMDQSSL